MQAKRPAPDALTAARPAGRTPGHPRGLEPYETTLGRFEQERQRGGVARSSLLLKPRRVDDFDFCWELSAEG